MITNLFHSDIPVAKYLPPLEIFAPENETTVL